MKAKEIKKSKPTARKTVKTVDPVKSRIKAKADENVCMQSETIVSESLCCCEDACC